MKASSLLFSLAVVVPLQVAKVAMTMSISLLNATESFQQKLEAHPANAPQSQEK